MDGDFQVGDWLARPHLNRLERGDERRKLQPRAMELLVYLAARPGQVVPRERILADVWGGRFIGTQALTTTVWELRRALGDPSRKSRYLQTVAKRGYRLIAPVSTAPAVAGEAPRQARTIGIAPWRDLSENGDRERFCAAMTELLTTMLAQVDALEVFLLGDPDVEAPPRVDLGRLDAVLEGAAQATRERVRLTARLVGEHGEHLWAAAYDRDLGDILRLQAEVVRKIVVEIDRHLEPGRKTP